ncbi:hypothetical protein ANANG_G00177180 [Anguilla anguilla]|uniref:Uncharacterized protein n=1 Tax=Anguilla anguilla TaxID=7936 RepID=A0A9D3M6A5_ANGAN|nr:hypothetical protein ANANG_G00177180 [Anguilla anguilla]
MRRKGIRSGHEYIPQANSDGPNIWQGYSLQPPGHPSLFLYLLCCFVHVYLCVSGNP